MEILRQPSAAADSEGIAVRSAGAGRPPESLAAAQADDFRKQLESVLTLAKLLADNESNNLTAQQVDFAQAIYAAGIGLLGRLEELRAAGSLEAPAAPEMRAPVRPRMAREEPRGAYRGRRSRRADEAVVMIVEGNAQVAAVMLDLVRSGGFQAVVASDLGTMKVLLREVAPEAVLIGGSLLDVDGWSTLELLRRDPLTRRTPISMSCSDGRRYACLQLGARSEWGGGAAERMLAALDGARGQRAARLLLAGVSTAAPGMARCSAGREVRSAASGRAALEALAHGATDALVIGPALGDMTTVELIRTISGEGLGGADLPLAIIDGPAAPLAVTVEIGMLRARARLEDILDATARHLARCVGDAGAARRSRAPQHRAAAGELAGRKALIVDDDVYNVYAVTAALEQAGMTVLPAETAREGIEALRAHPDADIVLIDISMPEIDGDSVIHALRATHERALPVIAVTPRAMPGDREKCLVAGASDYVSKPVNVEQLLATVRHWLATT